MQEVICLKANSTLITPGVLGGYGPRTTANFYLNLVSKVLEIQSQLGQRKQRPSILINNAPSILELEEQFIVNGRGADHFLKYLIKGARNLENSGADFLVLPCNTLHIFHKQIRDSVNIPVLNILESAALKLIEKGVGKVVILATTHTIELNLYGNILKSHGIEAIYPDKQKQNTITKIIHRVLDEKISEEDAVELKKIIDYFKSKDVRYVLLGCTDLQILLQPTETILDSMDILVETTARAVLGELCH